MFGLNNVKKFLFLLLYVIHDIIPSCISLNHYDETEKKGKKINN